MKRQAAQVGPAKKAAALKAANAKARLSSNLIQANEAALTAENLQRQHDERIVHGARAPPERLLDKAEVCHIANVTFPTVWQWMRDGKFPRSRVVGGKSMWLSSEVDRWLAALPVRPLKGDASSEEVA